MGRWEPDSRGRLQEAALALYSERGFDQTTATEIAARADVTERTFFRHITDEREVLFGSSRLLHGRTASRDRRQLSRLSPGVTLPRCHARQAHRSEGTEHVTPAVHSRAHHQTEYNELLERDRRAIQSSRLKMS